VATKGSFERARVETEESPDNGTNRIDVWKDRTTYEPRPKDRVDDLVSGAAALSDGSVWLSSFSNGLAHLGADGRVLATLDAPVLANHNLGAVAADLDDSVWAGHNYSGGLERVMNDGTIRKYGAAVLGNLADMGVADVQVQRLPGGGRDLLVAFADGAVAVYAGP